MQCDQFAAAGSNIMMVGEAIKQLSECVRGEKESKRERKIRSVSVYHCACLSVALWDKNHKVLFPQQTDKEVQIFTSQYFNVCWDSQEIHIN